MVSVPKVRAIVMVKRIKLVLTQDISKLGKNGDLVEVAPGYARNFLLPQGKAVNVTPGVLKQVERRREIQRQKALEEKRQAETQRTAIEAIGRFTIAKQEGENQSIFGTVTNAEVAEVLKEQTGYEVDRRDITLPDIHQLGHYKVEVKLYPEVVAVVTVDVVAK